jgi:RNAse (barnase) inhibitor barstar
MNEASHGALMSGIAIINVSLVRTTEDLHELLSDRLGFPDYYGRNWDAFWDCIRDPMQSVMPPVLLIYGFDDLLAKLPRDARIFRRCLEDLHLEREDVRVQWGE